MMINKDELIEWCESNLRFDNTDDVYAENVISDILEGYDGQIQKKNGSVISYSCIRLMFEEDELDEE